MPSGRPVWPLLVLMASSLTILMVGAARLDPDARTSLLLIHGGALLIGWPLVQGLVRVSDLTRPTLHGFFFLTWVFTTFLVSPYLVESSPSPAHWRYLIAVASPLVTVPVGGWIVSLVTGFRATEVDEFFRRDLAPFPGQMYFRRLVLLLVISAIVVTVGFLLTLREVPLFHLLTNPTDGEAIDQLRQDALVESTSVWAMPSYYYTSLGYPFAIMLTLGGWLTERTRWWRTLFLVAAVAGLLHLGVTTAKSPVAHTAFMTLLFALVLKGGRLSLRTMGIAAAAVVAFPLAVTAARIGDGGVIAALEAVVGRVLEGPNKLLMAYFEVFPDLQPYLGGRSIGRLADVTGMAYFDVPNFMAFYYNPGSVIQTGNANAPFVGNLNADWGMTGVWLGGLCAGLIMQALQVAVVRRPKTVPSVALYAFLIVAFYLLNHTALPPVLLSYGTVYACVLTMGAVWLCGWLDRRGRTDPHRTEAR